MEKTIDYEKIGFKCGLECHQQLETHKLFCQCPSIVNDTNPNIKIIRKLRAVAGETGKIDSAAEHEKKKDKFFVYEACSTSSCLVELDEEPPHPINIEALEIVVEAAKLFNAAIVDEIQVMRKTVVDGSNTSGFQRTALIATDGYINTSMGKVRIPFICLEEEAAKRIREDEKSVTFRLDRLGVPLIEVSTATDINNPEHARECAEKIGLTLRSCGKVKRGIGTIRQDVNVSIKEGARTEIKGFQDLKTIPKVIEKEVKRQIKIVGKGEKIEEGVRKAEHDCSTTFLRPMPGAARMYPETDIIPIKPNLSKTSKIELIDEKAKRYEKEFKLSKDLALKISKSEKNRLFETITGKCSKIKPAYIAEILISAPREIRRKHGIDIDGEKSKLDEKGYEKIFYYLENASMPKAAVLDIMIEFSNGNFGIDRFKGVDNTDLEKEIKNIVKNNTGKNFGALMGIVMAKFKGKADGKTVSDILKKLI